MEHGGACGSWKKQPKRRQGRRSKQVGMGPRPQKASHTDRRIKNNLLVDFGHSSVWLIGLDPSPGVLASQQGSTQ